MNFTKFAYEEILYNKSAFVLVEDCQKYINNVQQDQTILIIALGILAVTFVAYIIYKELRKT